MKIIQLLFEVSDDLSLKSVTVEYNGTDLASDSTLIKNLCTATLKSLINNKDSVVVQDLLNELGIVGGA